MKKIKEFGPTFLLVLLLIGLLIFYYVKFN